MDCDDPKYSRRELLAYLGASAGMAVQPAWAGSQKVTHNDLNASSVVETTSGKIRGAYADGVFSFKGVPYGASTAGANRFMPPRKPAPWTGVRDALAYGPIAMQEMGKWPEPWGTLMTGNMTWDGHTPSEDCLVLNVWTPALDGRKRPVMFWCHGGGFSNGSGEADWHDGTRLAQRHDVVLVHLNHRLNVFGFLYLAELGGEKYADSGNVGMLDIVAALEWVRENIGRFGGDPGNVTTFGESGGGGKVTALMAMPPAKGLFHKAIVESGSYLRAKTREQSTDFAQRFLKEAGIARGQIDRLQELPAQRLLEIKKKVEAAEPDPSKRINYRPTVDGRSLPRHPFDPDAPQISADIPMLIGTTEHEFRFLPMFDHTLWSLDRAGLDAKLKEMHIPEAKIASLVKTFESTRPGAKPIDLYTAIVTEHDMRRGAVLQAERKHAQGTPAYMYLFTWQSPDGQYKAGHNLEVPFVFDNPEAAPKLRGPRPNPKFDELAARMSAAWVAFARTGNPNHPGLPHWQPYDPKERATMEFNYTCRVIDDPLREDRLAMEVALGGGYPDV